MRETRPLAALNAIVVPIAPPNAGKTKLCPRQKFAGSRVDLQCLVFFNVFGHLDDQSGLQRGRFGPGSGRISFHAWVTLGDFQFDSGRDIQPNSAVVVNQCSHPLQAFGDIRQLFLDII